MDREAESVALEKKHVRDVYDRIAPHFVDAHYKAWPRVKEFLLELEPGSIVADVGCGNGKYLGINNRTFKVGCDCCANLVEISVRRGHEAMVCDNLRLPYRDSCFDAVISIAVVHHFATVERRVQAIQELARICRPGGLVMIYVWALEQKHRQFDAQDVLVPWHLQPKNQRSRRVKAKQNNVPHSKHSSSSASDEEDKSTAKSDKGSSSSKTSGKLPKGRVHPSIKTAHNGGLRTRAVKTLQRHTTERDWLREKFPNRRELPCREEARALRKCYSCEESVVLSGKPRTSKLRCQSDSSVQIRMVSRSSSVEEGEQGGTMWDGFLQVFPPRFSPMCSERSEDDVTVTDVGSVFGDEEDDAEDAKSHWCVINKDGSMITYDNGKRTVNYRGVRSRKSRPHSVLDYTNSCDSILPQSRRSPKNIFKRSSLLVSSQSLDERDFESPGSPFCTFHKFGAMRKGVMSLSHNSESAIDGKNLKGSNLKVSAWGSDTSGFVSSNSVNGDSSEATKKLLKERKQQMKLNLRSSSAKDKSFNSLNGVFTRSLELLSKSEAKTSKKPIVGLNFTTAKGEVFKPFRNPSHFSVSGSEKDFESSLDSVSSSDESLTTYPINPLRSKPSSQDSSPKLKMPARSHSLSTLEKLKSRDTKIAESPLSLPPKPSSLSLSLNESCSFEPYEKSPLGRAGDGPSKRPSSNPNLSTVHQEKTTRVHAGSEGRDGEAKPKDPDDASLYLRYYHVFKEGELTDLIERNIDNLHIVKSYYDHANWCVVAEKVEVWHI
ncbi:uncharacterized protein [Diadema setosum]|uniref:uncharacterized protein n=1 Tax=Diadema setosum TaxID=31175 RepID=UPI003B3B37BF